MSTKKIPRVGIGVFVYRKDGTFLLGKRKGAHGEGEWSLPGGHLEFRESLKDCAIREVREEAGIEIKNVTWNGYITNDIFDKEDLHYITIYMQAFHKSGKPEIKEPQKCDGWKWVDINKLPSPLFLPIKNLFTKMYRGDKDENT